MEHRLEAYLDKIDDGDFTYSDDDVLELACRNPRKQMTAYEARGFFLSNADECKAVLNRRKILEEARMKQWKRVIEMREKGMLGMNEVNWEQNAKDLAKVRDQLYEALEAKTAALEAANARVRELESGLREARAAMQPFRDVMDVPNTDITEILTVDYTCTVIDKLLGNSED